MTNPNIVLEIFAAIVLALILISCCLERRKSRQSIGFIGMLASNSLALVAEAVSISLKGVQGMEDVRQWMHLISYSSGYLLCFFYVNYVHACIREQKKISNLALRITAITGVLGMVYLVIGVRQQWFFTIINGEFSPTPHFLYSLAYDIVGMTIAMILILRYRKALPTKDFVALISFPALVIVAIFMQYYLLNKASQLFILTMLSCVVIYLMIQNDRINQTALQERRMEDMNVQLMLSQIQPHFIFNALSSIRRLIQKDSETAVKAVEQFSLYLRKNLESLNSSRLVAFQQELEHVQEYLYLEKLRFGERLQVEFDVQCSAFSLPVLTLQPIVENAVRHGILVRSEGGLLRISTQETQLEYVICVEDNGVGFEPYAASMDDRRHIGIPMCASGF